MSAIISVDEVLRAVLKQVGEDAFFPKLGALVSDLAADEADAIITTYQLGNVRGACELLDALVGEHFTPGFFLPDAWVRVPPSFKDPEVIVDGRRFKKGEIYKVPKTDPVLRIEPRLLEVMHAHPGELS